MVPMTGRAASTLIAGSIEWLEAQGQGDLRSLSARERDRANDGRAHHPGAERNLRRVARPRCNCATRHRALPAHGDRCAGRAGRRARLSIARRRSKPICRRSGCSLRHLGPPAACDCCGSRARRSCYYGLYRTSQLEHDNALFDLVTVRGTLATIFDGLFPANTARGVKPQILLDMLLFELDRGIDLFALGSGAGEGGPTDWRAYALWEIIRVVWDLLTGQYCSQNPDPRIRFLP